MILQRQPPLSKDWGAMLVRLNCASSRQTRQYKMILIASSGHTNMAWDHSVDHSVHLNWFKGKMSHTISWLSEQRVVWVDDLIGQNVKPLPNYTLALKHTQYSASLIQTTILLFILLTAELQTTHHTLLAMETNSNALFEFFIGGLWNHLTATPKYGIWWWYGEIPFIFCRTNVFIQIFGSMTVECYLGSSCHFPFRWCTFWTSLFDQWYFEPSMAQLLWADLLYVSTFVSVLGHQ